MARTISRASRSTRRARCSLNELSKISAEHLHRCAIVYVRQIPGFPRRSRACQDDRRRFAAAIERKFVPRLDDSVCRTSRRGSTPDQFDQALVESGRSGRGGDLSKRRGNAARGIDHVPNAKGNFLFDRMIGLDRSRSVLDLRLKR